MKYKPLLALALLLSAFFATTAQAQSFVAPVARLADPNIVHHNGWYYYMGTGGNGIKMKRAKTLEGLKGATLQTLFSQANGGPCCDYWAPELHRINDTWYIYYTANNQGPGGSQRMWVVENTSDNPMAGNWTNRGRVYDPAHDFWAIDATVQSINGQLYYVYSGVDRPQDGDKPQRLYIARMSNPWTLSSQRVLLSSPEFGWETDGLVNEGPAMLHRNGKVFLTYSGSGCWTPNYAIGMLWIDDWEDPMNPAAWEKLNHSVFSKAPGKDMFGPGHHSFFNSPDGSEVWMTYHATPKSAGACDGSRTTYAKKIDFDGNGFPIFGTPTKSGVPIQAPSGEPAVAFNGALINGRYKITAATATRPLDLAGCSPLSGTNVQQWASNNSACQQWHIQATDDGFYWIGSARSGLALEIESCSSDNATNVRVWNPNGTDCQKWSIIANGNGTYRIINKASNKALDIQFGDDNNGANLQTYTYLGNPQQHFALTLLDAGPRIQNDTYEIISKRSGKALDLQSCSNDNGANIIQYQRLQNDCQRWQVQDAGQGFYRIISDASGKALNVANCANTPGTNLQQMGINNSDCQLFSLRHQNNGWYSLIAKANGLAVDVAGCSTNNNANVHFWTNLLNDCQLWRFEKANNNGTNTVDYFREAENSFAQSPVQTEPTTDPLGGNLNVGWIDAGDWMAYDQLTIPASANYQVQYRVASPNTGRQISLDLNAGSIALGSVTVPNTGGWQNWQTITQTVYIEAGDYKVGISTPDGGWNINWLRISSQ